MELGLNIRVELGLLNLNMYQAGRRIPPGLGSIAMAKLDIGNIAIKWICLKFYACLVKYSWKLYIFFYFFLG